VQFKTDERNLRSQKSIVKLGATQEGRLRSFKQRRDGSRGDTHLYSIISTEWPKTKEHLLELLDAG
jgi:N-acetyltransferase